MSGPVRQHTAGLAVLARATTRGDRTRQRPLVAAVAAAGALVGVAAAVARMRAVAQPELAPFVGEPGLRIGVVLGSLLLVLPVALLALQALRLGSAEQNRRLAALRLVGATPAQRRGIAALRTGRAGLLGGVSAGPAYLLLWFLIGLLPPPGYRLLPLLQPADLATWAAAVVLGGLVGVLTGLTAVGAPRGRTPAARRGGLRAAGAVSVAVLAVAGVLLLPSAGTLVAAPVVGVGALLLVRGPLVAAAIGRLSRRGGAVDVLAAARLAADPAAPARAAVVLGLAGLALGVQGGFAAQTVGREAATFYLAGVGLAGVATVVAVLVTSLSLVEAGRRPGRHRPALRRGAGRAGRGSGAAPRRPAPPARCSVAARRSGRLPGGAARARVVGIPRRARGGDPARPAARRRTARARLGSVRVAVALVASPLRAAVGPANLRVP